MRINFLIAGIYRSGGMQVICRYANELSARGHDVILYRQLIPYNYMKGNSTFLYLIKFYSSKLINHLKRKERAMLPELKVTVKTVLISSGLFIRDADVSIATEWVTAFPLIKFSPRKGAKVYFIQGYETWGSNLEKVYESYRLQLNRITISGYLHKLIKERHSSDSTIIMNGIDFNYLYNKSERKAGEIVTIGFVYSKVKQKNSELIIRILQDLKTRYEIRIISFGFEVIELPEFIDYYINPSTNQIREIYSSADIFLFLSTQEGFALPPAEAMACKCAVVTTKTGAVCDYSRHLQSAIHINDADNLGEIYGYLHSLLEDKNEINRIGNNAGEEIKKILSWKRSVDQMEDFLLKRAAEKK
jgi:glycosyltransferase involved in cell wall biosynthesis